MLLPDSLTPQLRNFPLQFGQIAQIAHNDFPDRIEIEAKVVVSEYTFERLRRRTRAHLDSEQCLKFALQSCQIEKTAARLKVDEQIDIAPRGGFSTCGRPEDAHITGAAIRSKAHDVVAAGRAKFFEHHNAPIIACSIRLFSLTAAAVPQRRQTGRIEQPLKG
jgi:hypothetical protein